MKKYRTGELFAYLGITRDTLRFYEEKGLISPEKESQNQYRQYDMYDIYQMMIIDFYRRRGASIQQIQELWRTPDKEKVTETLALKRLELEKTIEEATLMLKRIEETQQFLACVESHLNRISVMRMPRWHIKGELSDFHSVEEYPEAIEHVSARRDDFLSMMVRFIEFSEAGVIGTHMLVVETLGEEETLNNDSGDKVIQYDQCLYTVTEEIVPSAERDIMAEMYALSHQYARENHLHLLGEAFARVRMVSSSGNEMHSYIEVFVPFEKIEKA